MGVVVAAILLCATVLLPWLIGRHLLRDNMLRVRETGVFDVSARTDGDYFLSDWLLGSAVVLMIAGVVLIRPRWSQRAFSVSTGLAFGTIAFLLLLPQASPLVGPGIGTSDATTACLSRADMWAGVIVLGDPGSGKSRLLEWIVGEAMVNTEHTSHVILDTKRYGRLSHDLGMCAARAPALTGQQVNL